MDNDKTTQHAIEQEGGSVLTAADYDINRTTPEIDRRRIGLLAEALASVLIKDGVLDADRPYTGPELLAAADAYSTSGAPGSMLSMRGK